MPGNARWAVLEVTERVRIGTQLLGLADGQPVTPVPQQGADGTLLAVPGHRVPGGYLFRPPAG